MDELRFEGVGDEARAACQLSGLEVFSPRSGVAVVDGRLLKGMAVPLETISSGTVSLHRNEEGAVRGFSDLEATASLKNWMKVGFGVGSSGPRRFGTAGLLRR